ncbi:MAG: hypothetical protein HY548_05030, partial [Elusimicrobia bacterium]|nr:hypothetical protein [Elusimicrobiota bacterium]
MKSLALMVFAAFIVSGCAQKRVALRQNFWENKAPRIGVALAPIPEPQTNLVGLPLLQYGIIHSANSGVRESIGEQVEIGRFSIVRDRFVQQLTEKGFNV